MRRHPKAKVVATLGPVSAGEDAIASLFLAGADVFRLDFSHGTHETHRDVLGRIRAVERDVGRPIGVLADLQGPKLRIGTFGAGPVTLAAGARFRLDLAAEPSAGPRSDPNSRDSRFAAIEAGRRCASGLRKAIS
jgi:pyruvate kinase